MKKLILILTFLLYALPNIAESRPKVGVVLSGGGAKGTAHVGVLKVLEKAGIPIDYIVGTSMGAIVGSLYSIGYSPEELDSIMMKQDWKQLLSDQQKEGLRAIRKVLGSTTNGEAVVQLIDMMQKTRCNADLLNRLQDWIALWEKSGYLKR